MRVDCDFGAWSAPAAGETPRGPLTWSQDQGAHVATVGGSWRLATLRRSPFLRRWVVSMPGFYWDMTGPRSTLVARVLRVRRAEHRSFATLAHAVRAVELAYSDLLSAKGGAETTAG